MSKFKSASREPVARANPMSDVPESLKRLERVGSETSTTTQKLIAAAAELADKIIAYFEACDDGTVIAGVDMKLGSSPKTRQKVRWQHTYVKNGGRLCFIRIGDEPIYVARNPEAALAFSEDVANGLLDGVVQRLEDLRKASAVGLPRFAQREKERAISRLVRHGDRLYGKNGGRLHVYDGQGAYHGSLICVVEGFHWVSVAIQGKATELTFEGRFPVVIPQGEVLYIMREEIEE